MSGMTSFVDKFWATEALPSLGDYIAIPCQSPAFDSDWHTNGLLDQAFEHLRAWAAQHLPQVPGSSLEVLKLPGRTPVLFASIPGEGRNVFLYGHCDKQPPMEGWSNGRSAFSPSLEGDHLYGRGGADDGYALYAAIGAINAIRKEGGALPPITILIEGSEESGSTDLPAYLDLLSDRIGAPEVIVALDAGCLDYSAPWLTTSLRGTVSGILTVRTLTQPAHSGDVSGIVPASFRVARTLLSRLEEERSGQIIPRDFYATIPPLLQQQAGAAGVALGLKVIEGLPLVEGVEPVDEDPATLLLNRAWRPQLTVTACDGLPRVAEASAAMHPETKLKLSLRLPPSLDPEHAARALKNLLERDPPYGATVEFEADMKLQGWHSGPLANWLREPLERAARSVFGSDLRYFGGGGGIPFLKMMSDAFPEAQFIVTGVLGPASNAHGPNEFLHIPTARRLTAMLALTLADLARS